MSMTATPHPGRPTEVTIGPHRYAILWDRAVMDRARCEEGEARLDGVINYSLHTIALDSHTSLSYQREVLLHELMHGILDVTGGNHFPRKATVDDVLNRMTAVLLDVLRRNAAVVAWLTDASPPAPPPLTVLPGSGGG